MEKFKKFFISSKPGIVLFVGITALASAYLGSSDPKRDILKIIFVGLGAVLSSGGSAIINNVLDRELDKLMTRTSKRPTATGEISPNEGIAVAVFLIILGLTLVFSFGGVVPFLLSFLAVILYDLLYTLILKRKSPFGVILGGLPGSLPTLIGYYSTAIGCGSFPPPLPYANHGGGNIKTREGFGNWGWGGWFASFGNR